METMRNFFFLGSKITMDDDWSHEVKWQLFIGRKAMTNVVQFSWDQLLSHPTLCDPMNRSTAGLPVHQQLPESTQNHVHQVSDAILLVLCRPLLLLPSIFPSIRVFSNELTVCIKRPKYCSFSLSTQQSPSTPQFKSINSVAFSFLYSPTLISIHDYWKSNSFDKMDLCWQSNVSAFEYAI